MNLNGEDEYDVYSDALEEPQHYLLHHSASFESLRTIDSEVSTMSVWLDPIQGQGQPPEATSTILALDPLHHPLQSLTHNTSPLSSGTSQNSLISEDIHGNSPNTEMITEMEVAVKTKTKGKLGAAFQHVYLIQQLRDAEFPIQGAIFCLCFSPDGHYLAAAGADKVIRVWSLLVKDALKDRPTNTQRYNPHLFKPDPILRLRGHVGEILDLSWAPQTGSMISSSMDGTVRLWHPGTGDTCLGVFPHGDLITSVAFHPKDARLFLSGSLDCRLRLWSIQEKCVKAWNELPAGNHITAVSFSLDGSVAMAGTSTGFLLFFDPQNNLKYHTQVHVRSQHGKNKKGRKISSIYPLPSKFGGEPRILVSSNDSRVRIYRQGDKGLTIKYRADGYYVNHSSQIPVSVSDDGEHILTGSESGHVVLWALKDHLSQIPFGRFLSLPFAGRDVVRHFEYFRSGDDALTQAIFAPDTVKYMCHSAGLRPSLQSNSQMGTLIITADFYGTIRVFENNDLFSTGSGICKKT